VDKHLFPTPDDGDLLTRRQWLTRRVVMHGVPIWEAIEATASTLLAHPEWDAEEERTWAQWQEEG
jgi:hypothetical protein